MPPAERSYTHTAIRTAAAVIAMASFIVGCAGSFGHSHRGVATSKAGRLIVTAARAHWQLPRPIARLVALADSGSVVLATGLTVGDASSSGVYRVDVTSGRLQLLGRLPQAVHDAAGTLIAGNVFVFGGGGQSTTGAVQELATDGHGGVVGHLPQPRSDLSAVSVGGRTMLIGGYTGSTLAGDILTTPDGRSLTRVGRLAVAVRYGAAVSNGSHVWVFGGAHGTQPVDDIQRIDTSGATRIVGHLPTALTEATALDVGGTILLAGGRTTPTATSDVVYAFDPTTGSVHAVARLPVAVADAGGAVVNGTGYLFGGENSTQLRVVQTLTVSRATTVSTSATAVRPATPAPAFTGRLLIADRGNNRLIVVDAKKHILWRYPSRDAPPPPGGFYFPDDAFFVHHGTGIISNQEGNNTIVELGFPSGHILWTYGHPRVASPRAGYLNQPDDAYLLADGRVVVADASNCRIVIVNPQGQQIGQIGTSGRCTHTPPTSLGYPNGDTPLPDGNLLISEIHGSWISEYTTRGHIVWTVQIPTVSYPSDPQQIGPDRYLVADYARPGGLVEFDRAGKVLWIYRPPHGYGMLDHPSLAEVLPGGVIAVNDDYRHRVVIIDPGTNRIIWQYGHTGIAGRGAGFLNTPDGFDLLTTAGMTPTHPSTG